MGHWWRNREAASAATAGIAFLLILINWALLCWAKARMDAAVDRSDSRVKENVKQAKAEVLAAIKDLSARTDQMYELWYLASKK